MHAADRGIGVFGADAIAARCRVDTAGRQSRYLDDGAADKRMQVTAGPARIGHEVEKSVP
jgi:hypothetical protein